MQISVLLFAGLAELAGERTIQLTLPEGATVQDLLQAASSQYPALSSLLGSCFISVNQEYAKPDTAIRAGDEIAILPPVSGGQDPRFAITTEPLSADKLVKLVSNPHAGAVLAFVGTVREFTHGQRTVLLAYEAYEPMAVEKMKQIASEVEERWPGTKLAMHHRIGELAIEEIAVVAAVATPHRKAAFEAGEYAIERLKQIVPIWKKEIWEDGSEWKGHQQGPWNPTALPDDVERS
ncbi:MULTISPECIES: molybdopterin converting factor subunit 1 [Brevibacillus]|jgi:molybdopterin synthase catalytic subunit|uniref:Molybdopterin synthase catalytic subunit n=1 Tax=Brevibacillus borstelensis AK1 TaxID=1300222 RepID=M8E9G6_9BACL|nr:molybdopterin converting factor subunit 1 [Brevibacillus borstelensis]EMT52105.1 molybdopterin converting factor MoaDE [Brevibacillus borstelensis AK1]KKX53517.1 molybdopterin converting factor [Brevibacillus borstelensis cifa_chp40]MBE5396013.1 molybdopterin converting factor subunit 1 [Brevibacillus borstelensis]MCM3471424.1 molybdopterin converting factor subunit 1 [Brevibacillus borstelensis]MCM3559514.1 molybdopterin converting factor subunit 1 [Brevibacillus borstelensis]